MPKKKISVKNKVVKLFPIEKILVDSASDYCASVGRGLRDYQMKGVTFEGIYGAKAEYSSDGKPMADFLINNFRQRVPENTEIIVNFRAMHGGVAYSTGLSNGMDVYSKVHKDLRSIASGTALIRRKKKTR